MAMRDNYIEKGKGVRVKAKRDQLSVKGGWLKETMNADMSFGKLTINMVHRETHLIMFRFEATRMECGLKICDTAKFLSGRVGDLEIYDLTGYPQK